MIHKENWEETKQRFKDWWIQDNTGRPLIYISAERDNIRDFLPKEEFFKNPDDYYFNVKRMCQYYKSYCETHDFMAEAFPNINLNYGTTSIALYCGAEPECRWDTMWYRPAQKKCWEELVQQGVNYEGKWLEKHIQMIQKGKKYAGEDYLLTIPDIGGSMDVLSLLLGAEELCYELMDEFDKVKAASERLTEYYVRIYDRFYDLVRDTDGSSVFTAFKVWAPGRTAKLECDFCALMSPDQFKALAVPALKKQAEHMDYAFYHLDGPDAIKHLDQILGIEAIKAIQWSHGAGNPDGLWDGWFSKVHDKVINAGKSLYLFVDDHPAEESIAGIKRLTERYGSKGIFLRFFDEMDQEKANAVLKGIG
ncbi:trimethylamine corrinoid protein 2 [Clostridium sp. MCC353]|uniref:hypothetical protein n=1 Tax=Clostridium sp. MCC353 TaxID=2592646 RepID=UPI001C00EF1A|nr:hypothetical protein [Clostridium sp. MCC353]MBT9775668.1 trimethylamine corrinoid protein 2 [Clostridium sp. MCC353]